MDEAGEFHARDVARVGVEAAEMSQIDFCASGKWSVRKPPPFFLEKKPLKPHRLSGKRADVEQVDDQQIARLGAFDADRAGEEVHDA